MAYNVAAYILRTSRSECQLKEADQKGAALSNLRRSILGLARYLIEPRVSLEAWRGEEGSVGCLRLYDSKPKVKAEAAERGSGLADLGSGPGTGSGPAKDMGPGTGSGLGMDRGPGIERGPGTGSGLGIEKGPGTGRSGHRERSGHECAQLRSSLSATEHDQTCVDAHPDYYSRFYGEPLEGPGRRPVSLVSTLSSDSSRDGHSLFGSTAALLPPASTPPAPSEDDVDLELSPSQGSGGVQGRHQSPAPGTPRGRWSEQREPAVLGSQRNNFHAWTGTSSRRKGGGGGGGGVGGGGAPYSQSSPVAADAMAPNPKLSYVDRVVMEIIETERMYVRDLHSIVEDYLAQIIDAGDLSILPEQVCALFGNIEDIYEFNSELLQSLDLCENDPVAIARCFVDKSEYFEIYTQYCTNYPNSVAALTDCMRSKTLAKFFRDRQASLKRSLPLGSYLLKPVQRILKYHLLLQEIAKHYDPEEEGYEVIQEAIDTMTGVAWYINDMKRKHEHAVRLQEIQSLLINWKGPDLTTYGELVLEGTFHVQRAKNSRTLFLFQEMLLITKKRGEHYVCKTHISCSTLMLLDSAKDPLTFSVIHFKHPKHPHIVQAKSMEEKRLWAHHIKRLILENHNTIVPQKVKETILEMDSMYAGKYRYSPERLKKAESCQAEDFPVAGRPERRRSEPAKQIHADSEGALLGDLCSLQPASSVSTLASSVGESQAERPGAEEEEEEEDVEERSPKRHSLEQLCPSDVDPKLGSAPSEGGLEEKAKQQQEEVVEEEEEGECYKEDILMGVDQVADFASSMLAAISCWHYRARALLSAPFMTDVDAAEEEETLRDVQESSTQDELPSEKAEEEALDAQVNVKEVSSSHCEEEPDVDNMPMEMNHSQLPDSRASPTLPVENPDPVPDIQEQLDTTTEDEKELESDSSCLQLEDSSILSFGEYSEEDEMLVDHRGLLPSSELDGAGMVAGHLASIVCRQSGVVVSEDPCSMASPLPQPESPQPESPQPESLQPESPQPESPQPESPQPESLQPESPQPSDKPSVRLELPEEVLNTSPDPRPESEASQSAFPAVPKAVQEEAPGEMERRTTLSKLDRLLIHKIRRYYEYAEHQDAGFSIKRRESLSYIPAGLVRHLSKQLNSSAPQGNPAPVHRKGSSASRPTSWSVFDLPGLEKNHGAEPVPKPQRQASSEASARPPSVGDASTADEVFQSSSEMLKVWSDMEMGMSSCPEELPFVDHNKSIPPDLRSEETLISRHNGSDMMDVVTRERPLQILEECELEHLSEQSSISVPTTPLTGSDSEYVEDFCQSATPRSCGKVRVARGPLPRIITLQSGLEDDQILQDMGKVKNKVFQLARQYSQRIKNNRPLIRQRNRDSENLHGLKSMPAVHEESTASWDNGEHNLTYPLNTCDQVNAIGELQTPSSHPSPSPSSRAATPQAVSSPSSPPLTPSSPMDSEAFHWPDVHELRSKYTSPRSAPGPASHLKVGRSYSVPERMLESCTGRHGRLPWSSLPKHHHRLPWDSPESQQGVAQQRGGPTTEDGGAQPVLHLQLCRWSSLDSMPVASTRPLHEVQNLQGPARTGRAALPTVHKVIIVERVPGTPLGDGGRTAGEQEVATTGSNGGRNEALNGVSKKPAAPRGNRKTESKVVKNLREKFQSLSSGS
ncbi:Pleckstrin y domain-containing family G member 3 [Merluccius polli]|uniref:Pleckstrin y domain-containing family G member 3 n=1 Tax=Merluccius polli TaxID=89951 RepID=A0AA47NQ18_MERPO|nr:Pleckstrin y domain-containing family G member 3 [Merluccius polli]